MTDRPNYLAPFNERIPEEFAKKGWRVLAIAEGETYRRETAYIAVLQNDANPAPNGYYSTLGRSAEEAVDEAIRAMIDAAESEQGSASYPS